MLGFTPVQAKNAVKFLSQPSPLASNLLGSLSALEASIEYLVLHIPECDLPERFLPSVNSSSSFVTSAHSGVDDLKRRWIEDKAVKEAGWPAALVRDCTSDPRLVESWDLLVAALGEKLTGGHWNAFLSTDSPTPIPQEFRMDDQEVESLGAHYEDPRHLVMPLFSAPIQLHILVSADGAYPAGYPPMYLTSGSIPAYVRLHLLAQTVMAVKTPDFVEPGEGFCMAAMRFLEGEWAQIEDNGPPDMSAVLRHIVPQTPSHQEEAPRPTTLPKSSGRKRGGPARRDDRTDQQVQEDFETLRSSAKVGSTLCRVMPHSSIKI